VQLAMYCLSSNERKIGQFHWKLRIDITSYSGSRPEYPERTWFENQSGKGVAGVA
jgi:hypothetical protein